MSNHDIGQTLTAAKTQSISISVEETVNSLCILQAISDGIARHVPPEVNTHRSNPRN